MHPRYKHLLDQLTPQEQEFKKFYDTYESKPVLHHPDHLENETIALMLDYPGHRRLYLNRSIPTDFKNKFNRAIFDAMGRISEPVNIQTIYEQLTSMKMAGSGIAEHLAMLNCLIGTDNPFPMLVRSRPLRDGAGGDGGAVPTFSVTSHIQR